MNKYSSIAGGCHGVNLLGLAVDGVYIYFDQWL